MTEQLPASGRPRLARHVRMTYDRSRNQHVLLLPETVVVLNTTGADILELCDGQHTVAEVIAELRDRYQAVVDEEVRRFLTRLVTKRFLEISDG